MNNTNGSGKLCSNDVGIDIDLCLIDHIFPILNVIFSCILLNIVVVIGAFGNVINIIVLSYHGMKESTNIILMSISVADLIFLVTLVARGLPCVIQRFDADLAIAIDSFVLVYIWVFNRLAGILSSAQVTLISIERFVAVYYPLTVSSLLSPKRTVMIIIALHIFWGVAMAPLFHIYSYGYSYDYNFNKTSVILVLSNYYLDNLDALSKLNVFIALLRGPIAVFVIFTSSVAICKRLHDANQKRSQMTSSIQKFDVRTVKMLLVVTSVYATIGIPVTLPYIMYYLFPQLISNTDTTATNLPVMLEVINDFLYAINASVNFLIYVTMSTKFYRTYSTLVSRLCIACSLKKNKEVVSEKSNN